MNAVVEQHPKSTSLVAKFADRYSVDPGRLLPTLKATAFKLDAGQVSDEQMMALLIVADQYGLNPFTKEIFAFPDKHKGIVPVVSVDGWARIINDQGALDGIEFVYGPAKGAHFEWIECVIYRKDRSKPVRIREFWEEVARSTGPWSTHGNRMHRHKALIQCARVAFGFGGIYDEDEAARIVERDITPGGATVVEMPRAKSEPTPIKDAEVIDQDTGEIGKTAGGTPHAGDASSPPPTAAEGEDEKKADARPMQPGQIRIIKAKLAQATLSEVDFTAKWGKPLTDGEAPNFLFSDFAPITAWIASRAG